MADVHFGVSLSGTDIDHVTAGDAGVRHFSLSPLCDNETLAPHLEIYARQILPQLR